MMKKFRGSIIARILAWILISASALGLVSGVVAAYGMQESGVYSLSQEELMEDAYETYLDRYSAMVIGGYIAGYEEPAFESSNYKYGLIQADSLTELKRMDLSSDSTYIKRNFEDVVDLEDMHIFECTITDDTWFSYTNPESLWGYYWISHTGESSYTVQLKEYIYDEITGIFYISAANTGRDYDYYPIQKVCIELYGIDSGTKKAMQQEWHYEYDAKLNMYRLINGDDTSAEVVDSAGEVTEEAYATEYTVSAPFTSDCEMVLFYDYSEYDSSMKQEIINQVFPILNQQVVSFDMLNGSLLDIGRNSEAYLDWKYDDDTSGMKDSDQMLETQIPVTLKYNSIEDFFNQDNIRYEDYQLFPDENLLEVIDSDEEKTYYVISYIPEELEIPTPWINGDLFAKASMVIHLAYVHRYDVYWGIAISLLLFMIALVYLVWAAGYRKDSDEVVVRWINKIPLEIVTIGTCMADFMIIWLTVDLLDYAVEDFSSIFWIVTAIFTLLCAGWLLLAYILDIAVRCKAKRLWKSSLVYMICSRVFGSFGKTIAAIRENIDILWRIILLFAFIAIVELLVMVVTQYYIEIELLFWLFEKVVVFVLLIAIVVQMRKLKIAGEHIAEGDLSYQVDTNGMFGDLKVHGENLNSIGDGMMLAVEEKIKSERFRTELITNVSHDIKTPLTSIINYVDLLKKEEISSETAQEYIEVLDRQSNRLKKLIEDLMEASKASTGNLAVNFEKLEAGVFMVQTVGEFEEKTKACGLELIIKKPEEPVYIMADGRHFWRVIDNLMNNICKYAQPQTRVYINLDVNDGKAYITFRNTSRYPLNISSDELMERFVRGDSSRNTEGNGLGLSIAGSLMELMHGKFELIVDGDLFKVVLIFDMC